MGVLRGKAVTKPLFLLLLVVGESEAEEGTSGMGRGTKGDEHVEVGPWNEALNNIAIFKNTDSVCVLLGKMEGEGEGKGKERDTFRRFD